MNKQLHAFIFFSLIIVLPASQCFSGVLAFSLKKRVIKGFCAAKGFVYTVQSDLILADSISMDSVTTDDTETRVIRTKSSESVKWYGDIDNSVVAEAGFSLSDMNLPYGLTYRRHFFSGNQIIGVGLHVGINKLSYSRKETSSDFVYDAATGENHYIYDTTQKTYAATTFGYGFFFSVLIAKKVDLVWSLGLMGIMTNSDSVLPDMGANLSLEGTYFFSPQFAAGVNIRGILLMDGNKTFAVVPGIVVKIAL